MRLKPLTTILTAVLLLTTFNSCDKDDEPVNTDVVIKNNIPLSSSQEVPANPSAATGSIDINYTKSTKVLNFTVRWSNLTVIPTAMHFHGNAGRGVNAGVLQGVTGFPAATTATHSGSITLNETTQKQDSLLAGRWYFNIHNPTYPGGEIRGQIEF